MKLRCSRCKKPFPHSRLVQFKSVEHYCPSCYALVVERHLKEQGVTSK